MMIKMYSKDFSNKRRLKSLTQMHVYNLHLAWLIERMLAQALSAPYNIGKEEPVNAEFVIRDYLRHVQHHLKDLLAE